MIQWAGVPRAGTVTVCKALKEALAQLGVDAHASTCCATASTLAVSAPDREAKRARLGLTAPTCCQSAG